MFEEKYEVYRKEYKNFIETFKPEFRRIEEEDKKDTSIIKVYSTLTNKLMCARVSSIKESEKYYIFNFPTKEEVRPPILKRQVVLNDIKQVQAFFDGLQKMQELHKND